MSCLETDAFRMKLALMRLHLHAVVEVATECHTCSFTRHEVHHAGRHELSFRYT